MMSKFMHTEKQRAPASSFHQTIVEAAALRRGIEACRAEGAGGDLAHKYTVQLIPQISWQCSCR